jgi:hypothetical protein
MSHAYSLSKTFGISDLVLFKIIWNAIEILFKIIWNAIEILFKIIWNAIEILFKIIGIRLGSF